MATGVLASPSVIVVSDTTALTTLLKCGLEEVLPGLFGEVLIPRAVAKELLQFHPVLPGWCKVDAAIESALLNALRLAVDPVKPKPLRWLMTGSPLSYCWMIRKADGRLKRWGSLVCRFLPFWSQQSGTH